MIHSDNFFLMFIISIISGLLSSMFIFADKYSDISIGLNDLYMAVLMTSWMFLIMGILFKKWFYFTIGLLTGITVLYLIRNQIFINKKEYLNSMIPHHSMAVMVTKRLRENNKHLSRELDDLTKNIIETQEKEIELMKELEKFQ